MKGYMTGKELIDQCRKLSSAYALAAAAQRTKIAKSLERARTAPTQGITASEAIERVKSSWGKIR